MDFEKINLITKNFFERSKVLKIEFIESGLINKTFLIEHLINGKKSKFILQCISNIFESYERININHELITDHIKNKTKKNHLKSDNHRWETPCLIKCNSNNLFALPFCSDIWRAMEYIDHTISFDILDDNRMAYQTGLGLAKFHRICSDIDLKKLENTIKDFHNTNYYLEQFNMIIKDYNFIKLDVNVKKRVQYLIFSLSNHILYVESLLGYLKRKLIQPSLIHGDPKLSNFLFDIQYKYVVSLIDLDTVSSGYLLTDLADCIRSICNKAGEDPDNIENVYFDINCFKYFLSGYFSITNKNGDYRFDLLPEFIYLLIVELTIRFLNDFLQSNRYFKIKYQTHNLYRAEVQYRLLSSFVTQLPTLSKSLHEIGISSNPTFVSDVQKIV
ncbi:aminoglycoside phosphotransferase family protein [Prochlorococcus marinus]|uniref:aminoglycoside phosphotransferase family protein n=1 Tax=Prochlorococcus marinus TaxID=1219 RepID=UPI0022B57083|nr:aminoglycoside phosphotransferase family protein [Prochlorococcus marinus]